MTLMERVRAVETVHRGQQGHADQLGLESLRHAVDEVVPLDRIALIMGENPERARNEIRAACRRVKTTDAWNQVDPARFRLLVDDLIATVFGFGPLDALIRDESVTEIMVNGCSSVYVEREGRLTQVPVRFESDAQVRALIDRILGPLGRRIDESSPLVSARLPQGHRVHAVIPPLALDGPCLTIRAFTQRVLTLRELHVRGSFDIVMERFLIWVVKTRKSIAVSGGTGSGKTTLLNALSCHIDMGERIITIEDAAELKFTEHPHVVRLEARAQNAEGVGEVTIRELVMNSLRMRPDRIIVGECRGGEAIDMLQAMNTGHDGSLTTLHANSPREAIDRLVTMVRYAVDLPLDAIESQIGNAFDLIVQTCRRSDGSRCVCEVSEVSFDFETRRCRLHQLYVRDIGQKAGVWKAVPQVLEDAVLRGFASQEEVEAWKQQACLPS